MSGTAGPGISGVWGQPTGEYMPMFGTVFDESLAIPLAFAGGFKLHISVAEDDAHALARVALPTLRLLHVHHKVVRTPELYQRMNTGDQRGKFITVYPGPAAIAQRVVDTVDPTLVSRGFRPVGPFLPTTRQSNHQTSEIRVGNSGLISCYAVGNYATD